jgi:hypothetical protein
MALAGPRVLWGDTYIYNDEHTIAVLTSAPGARERVVGRIGRNGGRASDPPVAFRPVRMAGDGKNLVFVDDSDLGLDHPPQGVVRVVGQRVIALAGTERAHDVAVSGDTIAYAEPSQGSCRCDTVVGVSWSTGATKWRFDLPRENHVRRLVLNGSRLVLMIGPRLEVRTTSGGIVRTIPASRAAAEIDLASDSLVYRVGRSIRLADIRSGAVSTLAKATGTIVGLSIEGRRVMWGEVIRTRRGDEVVRTSPIRQVVLPR